MAISTIPDALDRIATTEVSSPLAVFSARWEGLVDAVFANTVLTQKRIQQGDPAYLGTFHCKNWTMAQHKLEREENLSKVATRSK